MRPGMLVCRFRFSVRRHLLNLALERYRIDRIKDIKHRLEEAKHEFDVAQREGRYEHASRLRFSVIPDLEGQLPKESEKYSQDSESDTSMFLLHDRITPSDIARVVSRTTGIPVQSLLKGEKEKLVHVRCLSPIHLRLHF